MKKTKRISLALAFAGLIAVGGCDQKSSDAQTNASGDKLAGAFNGELKDCAAAAQALSVWIGQPYAAAASTLQPAGPVKVIRVIRPGNAVTQDYSINRLNVDLDDKDIVVKIYCG